MGKYAIKITQSAKKRKTEDYQFINLIDSYQKTRRLKRYCLINKTYYVFDFLSRQTNVKRPQLFLKNRIRNMQNASKVQPR